MRQLFVIDPIETIKPEKDSSAALMQAAQRASIDVWVCVLSDLYAFGDRPKVIASPVKPEPWITIAEPQSCSLENFACIWMRKDPPVDEAFLYATHLLEIAERAGVRVINKPAALRAWNEKLGALRFSELMAPTFVASRVSELIEFARSHKEIVIKPLAGRAGQGVLRVSKDAPGLKALLELVTDRERLPVMAQSFLPSVMQGDKRILLVNGEPLGAVNRLPSKGDFRSNLAMGGKPEATEISEREQEICEVLCPVLKNQGLFFVGIDVIDGMLSEINVTSPTGIREIEKLMHIPIADQVIDRLLKGFD